MTLHPIVQQVTENIIKRSAESRRAYLSSVAEMAQSNDQDRTKVSCSNLAHAGAGAGQDQDDVTGLSNSNKPNIAIVSAYNDMLSAHQPFENYPQMIRAAARQNGATAQMAGGVPAMCDGVTQGRPGMELSLASRDVVRVAVHEQPGESEVNRQIGAVALRSILDAKFDEAAIGDANLGK